MTLPATHTYRQSETTTEGTAMGMGGRFFAATYDRFMSSTEKAGLADHRAKLLAAASGDVLEIGGGTGTNLAYYGPSVASLNLVEPAPAMVKRLDRKARAIAPTARVLRAPAEDLPYDDASFDTVVSTLVLCSVADQPRAVAELRRVLRPDGRLLFLEHVRSEDPKVARMQDRMNVLNRVVVHCDCNRPTVDTLRSGGFTITAIEHSALPKSPPFARPMVIGTAGVGAVIGAPAEAARSAGPAVPTI
jgi:SAM-dependent methyltransferase